MSKIFTKGNNVVNQLGCSRKVKENFWKQVKLPSDCGKMLKIDANPGQTAVLTDTGDVFWWGWVLNSQTMTKIMNGYRRFPTLTALFLYNSVLRKLILVPNVSPEVERVPRVKDSYYTDFKFGNAFMILKGEGGELYGYGDNAFGQCGYNSEGRGVFAEPAQIKPSTGIDDLTFDKFTVGMQFGLGVDSRGDLFGFGRRGFSQYLPVTLDKENVTRDYFSKPTLCIKPLSGKLTHIAAGHNHTVYVCDNKRVFCTGFNYYGQCGLSNTVDELLERYEEIEMPLENGEKIVSVSCGMNHNVLLTTHNRVLFWGNTTQNQFPNFKTTFGHDLTYTGALPLPLPLQPSERITKLKAYVNRSLVFTDSGRVLVVGGEDASKYHGLPKINYVDLSSDKFFEGKTIVDVALGVWHTAVLVE